MNKYPSKGMSESFFKVGYRFMFENIEKRKPDFEIPFVEVNVDSFANKNSDELSVIWLGHATTLINIDGTIILTDPMFSEWASPVSWIGPKKFFDSPIEIEELPILDAVLISHNHFDHLDKESVLRLNGITKKFIVPTGVEKHLLNWGISSDKIIIKNWWDTFQLNDEIEIITTPAHHFSGRGLFDRNKTLWASFIIKSKNHSIYFGGDSGFFNVYKEIGDKHGPFDITILPIGAYSKMWASIHMNAEEGVRAHIDLKGNLLIPIHWGTFNLSLHSWIEPAEDLIEASEKENVNFTIPKPGEVVKTKSKNNIKKWWIKNKAEENNGVVYESEFSK
ncbi:MAG: MBL fold metallo-hydrolase [Melioribacteraceae bacterium]|nr:MBL fold metallo-hydrolase [Melioribacteraceae bacterium]